MDKANKAQEEVVMMLIDEDPQPVNADTLNAVWWAVWSYSLHISTSLGTSISSCFQSSGIDSLLFHHGPWCAETFSILSCWAGLDEIAVCMADVITVRARPM